MNSPKQLSQDLQVELQREMESLRIEDSQIRTLVQDAVGKLGDSFRGLREQSERQSDLVSGLTSSMDSETNEQQDDSSSRVNIRSFVLETDKILQTFVEHIIEVSKQSMAMVYRIDDVSTQMTQVEAHLGKINSIAELTKVLSLNARIVATRAGEAGSAFSVVATEVRKLASASREVSDLISDLVIETNGNVVSVKNAVKDMASKDMSFAMEAKSRVDGMMAEVSEIDRFTAEVLQKVSALTGEISHNVGMAILSLQFEDMVTQLTQSMDKKVTAVEGFARVFDLEHLMDDTIPKEERLAKLQLNLMEHQQFFDTMSHKPVTQDSMDEGDIELF